MTQKRSCSGTRAANRWRDESGSILIPVAVYLLGLLAFSAFTVDNGIMLSSRRQAQNAADAGALAAALYLAWDDSTDQAGAQALGVVAAQENFVFGGQPDVTLADVTFPTCPPGAPGLVDTCVRVDVFRNQRANGSPLPAFFASLVGINTQGVRATATAQVIYGEEATTASCLLPFAIPDRWTEIREEWQTPTPAIDDSSGVPANYPIDGWTSTDVWDPDDEFDVVTQSGQHGGVTLFPEIMDFYDPTPMTGTGFGMANDNGLRVMLKANNTSVAAPSYYYPIVLPDGLGTGGNNYRFRINNCTELTAPVQLGDTFTSEPGNMVGPTNEIINLINADPSASWYDDPLFPSPATSHPVNSGAFPAGGPRLRTVATFDVEDFMTGHRTARGSITVTGFVGIFIDDFVSGEINARITTSNFDASATNVSTNTESFLRDVVLVR